MTFEHERNQKIQQRIILKIEPVWFKKKLNEYNIK